MGQASAQIITDVTHYRQTDRYCAADEDRRHVKKRCQKRKFHNAFNDILSRHKPVRFPQEDQWQRFLRKSFA